MIKKTLYPKTARIGFEMPTITLTEKLDGSNLAFFKLKGELYIAQRSTIMTFTEAMGDNKGLLYKGLYTWLLEHGSNLQEIIHEGSVVNGEWIGMGKLHYDFPHKFYMFAKSVINEEDFTLKNIYYDHSLFKWVFDTHELPEYIDTVPIVAVFTRSSISVEELDQIYDNYTKQVGRNVEGFVIAYDAGTIKKYVRMKNGRLAPHHA